MTGFRPLLIEKMSQRIPWLRSLIFAGSIGFSFVIWVLSKKVGVLGVDPSGFLYVMTLSYGPSGAGYYCTAC